MSTATFTPARQEALLAVAEKLAERLRRARVPFADGDTADVGVPRNCIGKVEGLLRNARDLDDLRATLALLHKLDPLEAQNPQRVKSQYATLRDALRQALGAHPDQSIDEWLYVLGWVRRLLPAERNNGGPSSRRDDRADGARADPRPARPPQPARVANAGERVWKGATLAFERRRVVARHGRDRLAEDTSHVVAQEIVSRLRQPGKLLADVTVTTSYGSAFRIVDVKNAR